MLVVYRTGIFQFLLLLGQTKLSLNHVDLLNLYFVLFQFPDHVHYEPIPVTFVHCCGEAQL